MVHQFFGPLVKRLRHRPLTPVTPVRFWYGSLNIVGAYGNEVTPVPIPNTEVKLIRVDDTWLATARETKSVPTLKSLSIIDRLFYIWGVVYIKKLIKRIAISDFTLFQMTE